MRAQQVGLRRWLILPLAVALCIAGCETQPTPATNAAAPTQAKMDMTLGRVLDPLALRGDVSAFLNQLLIDTIDTSNLIATRTTEPRVREATVRGKIRMSTVVQNLRQERDPRQTFVYAWLLTEQSLYYLTEGWGKDLYGDQQQLMVDLMQQKKQQVLDIGKTHFPDVDMTEVQEEALAMAQRYVTEHQTFSSNYDPSIVGKQQDKNAVTNLLSIPMAPVTALGGVGDMPTVVDRATQQVQQTSLMIRDLPERLRWQFELAMLQMDQYAVVTQALKEMEATRMSIDRIGATANGLPAAIRHELDATLGKLNESQPQWQATIAEASRTMEQTTAALEQASKTLAETERVRDSLTPVFTEATQTAEAWRDVITQLQALTAKDPNAAETEPVTVADITAIAHEAREAAVELRSLLTELREPIADESGLMRLSGDWRATIDALTWRLAGLVVLAFVLAVVYALVAARLRTKQAN